MSKKINTGEYIYFNADGTPEYHGLGGNPSLEFNETDVVLSTFTGLELFLFIKLGKDKEVLRFAYADIEHFCVENKKIAKHLTVFFNNGRKLTITLTSNNAKLAAELLRSHGVREEAA